MVRSRVIVLVIPGPSSRGSLSVPQRVRVRAHLPGTLGATLNAAHTLVRERKRAGHQLGLVRLSITEVSDQSLVRGVEEARRGGPSCGKNYLHHRFRLASKLNGLLPFADGMNDWPQIPVLQATPSGRRARNF